MKFLAILIILILLTPYSFAAHSMAPCYSAKTMLTQAFECIKAKQMHKGIALYIHVLKHPNSTLHLVLEAAKELKSHHYKKEAILGFVRALYFPEISETQLLYVGENLIELEAYEKAKQVLRYVSNHPQLIYATHRHIVQLYTSMAKTKE